MSPETRHVVKNFCYLLECEAATFEAIVLKKTSSKYDRERHASIIRKCYTSMEEFITEFLADEPMMGIPRVKEMATLGGVDKWLTLEMRK